MTAAALRRLAFNALLTLALAAALAFLFLPLLAIFLEVPTGKLVSQLGEPVVRDALVVTLKTTLVANVLIVLIGTPAAYLVASRRFRGRALVITLLELPLVLPPAVAGIGLLAAFGTRQGLLGSQLDALGISLPFTQAAVTLAILFVASPFFVRQAVASFEAVDQNLVDASRTLGAGPGRTFFRVALPLALGGLGAGAALAFARGLGEFGATIMFAGNLQGVTQTFSLAIYDQFERDFDAALAIGALLVVLSGAILLGVKLVPGWRLSTSISPFRGATSSSG